MHILIMSWEFEFCDLFAGVGGIRLGLERAGFKAVFANDVDKKAAETYNLNFSNPGLEPCDVWRLDLDAVPECGVLAGGFPCQPFSIAGYRRGFNDRRNGNLFFRILDIVDSKMPQVVFLENVKNLESHDHGRTFKIIRASLEERGYRLKYRVLNAMDFGLPQNRERIFIAAFRDRGSFESFEFPSGSPLKTSFRDFLDSEVDEKYYYNGKPLYQHLKEYNISFDTVYQWRRVYLRENKKGVVPTLTANMGSGGHNVPIIRDEKGVRKFTPGECFRLQGFPDSFRLPDISDAALYHQAGNSVPVPVVEAVGIRLRNAIGHASGSLFEPLHSLDAYQY
jgi:DNA (cytosine-5)-methyltransferase 1